MEHRDFAKDAEKLFRRFANRHALTYEVRTGVPIEVCWDFPVQDKLHLPITLGLQNGDELNFGVSDFWSYFFPFNLVSEEFENALNAWVAGNARIAVTGIWSRVLQVRKKQRWKTIYGANGCLFPFRFFPFGFVYNDAESAAREMQRINRSA